LAAGVLAVASLFWYQRLQSWDTHQATQAGNSAFLTGNWWSEPVVYNHDAALPEISGRLYGVAIENRDGKERIWVVGTKGFLAYSADGGQCWTPFAYQADQGLFREITPNPCANPQSVELRFPDLIPTVHAAEPQSSAPRQQSPAQQSYPNSPVEQRSYPNMNAASQQARAPFSIQPSSLDFGQVSLAQGKEEQTYTRNVTVYNNVGREFQVFAKGLSGDPQNEFSFNLGICEKVVDVKSGCTITVRFTPRSAGNKQVELPLYNSYSSSTATLRIQAAVLPAAAAQTSAQNAPAEKEPVPNQKKIANSETTNKVVPPVEPARKTPDVQTPPAATGTTSLKAPIDPPDLLAIGFEPSNRIVSTGGETWSLDSAGAWVFTPQTSGTTVRLGGRIWTLTGPAGKWATETRVRDFDRLSNTSLVNGTRLELQKKERGTDISKQTATEPAKQENWPDSQLPSVAFDSRGQAWVAGWSNDKHGDHAILARSGEGADWLPLTRGALAPDRREAAQDSRAWMWMPRWYLAMVLLSLALAALALVPPAQVEPEDTTERESVEGRLSSDRPLDPGDRDVLGLTEIALGLSAFLRNEKTLPPLTVAINGEWGTGKSSLMNLLRCDLKSYGMCPVWFNAWHHQKEEHLLAALLQTVKLEAVPPAWNLLGVPFRARLMAYHLKRRWPLLLIVAAVITFLVVLDYHLRIDHGSDLFLWLTSHIIPSVDTKASPPASILPVQGGLIAVITTIAALWKGMTAFGANPASLLASVAQGNKMKDLEAQTSFRQRFAVEFRDFTNALGPRRPLVIFIDDLDRCLPANVRDVLEAVNFLVSSGDCFVVLGMDRVQVQRAVGLSFKEVAEEAGPMQIRGAQALASATQSKQGPSDAAELAREKRAEFAQKYLEKLVNLEVRVPLAEDDASQQGLFEKEPPAKPVSDAEKAMRTGLRVLRWAVPLVLGVLLLWGAGHFSVSAVPAFEAWMKENPEPAAPPPASQNPQQVSQSPGGTVVAVAPSQQKQVQTPAVEPDQSAGEIISPFAGEAPAFRTIKTIWPARWMLSLPLYLTAIFLLLVANVVLTTRPGVVTHDSQQFTDAMEKVWYPLVLAKQNTPRSAKRFVNRVRYLAMRQRFYRDDASLWERTLFPQRLASPPRGKEYAKVPEPLLVAMAAMEQMEPSWVYDPVTFQGIVDGTNLPNNLLTTTREKHCTVFEQTRSQWNLLTKYREAFLAIWPRVSPEEAQEEARGASMGS
jgi:hypothetical protein